MSRLSMIAMCVLLVGCEVKIGGGSSQPVANPAADREAVRARIEQQARIDAIDVLRKSVNSEMITSEFTIKESSVTYLGDTPSSFLSVSDNFGYRADMYASIRTNLAVAENVQTYRLKLRYDLDGRLMPDYCEVETVGQVDPSSPFLSW